MGGWAPRRADPKHGRHSKRQAPEVAWRAINPNVEGKTLAVFNSNWEAVKTHSRAEEEEEKEKEMETRRRKSKEE